MFTIERFNSTNKELFNKAVEIRIKVFVEEQMVNPELEIDESEILSTHYLVFKKNLPIATARWRETKDGIKIERIAIIREYRSQQIGSYLLNELLKETKVLRRPIYLHSQVQAKGFYEKHGFVAKGEPFIEDDIIHIKMAYDKKKKH